MDFRAFVSIIKSLTRPQIKKQSIQEGDFFTFFYSKHLLLSVKSEYKALGRKKSQMMKNKTLM